MRLRFGRHGAATQGGAGEGLGQRGAGELRVAIRREFTEVDEEVDEEASIARWGEGGRGVMSFGRRHDSGRFGDVGFEGAIRKSGESCASGREQGSMRKRMRRKRLAQGPNANANTCCRCHVPPGNSL